jgi:ribosome recycling factor
LVEKLRSTTTDPRCLQQLASFSVPGAHADDQPVRQVVGGAIEQAIQGANLGLNPSNDGVAIRLAFPPLTEERRKEFVKLVRSRAEESATPSGCAP